MEPRRDGDSKPPFDTLVSAVSDLLKVALRDRQDVFRTVAKVLRDDLQCDLRVFALTFLEVPSSMVDELADGNGKIQIDSLLAKWVELLDERATVEAVLKAVYDADETVPIQKIVETLRSGLLVRSTCSFEVVYIISYAYNFWLQSITVLRSKVCCDGRYPLEYISWG